MQENTGSPKISPYMLNNNEVTLFNSKTHAYMLKNEVPQFFTLDVPFSLQRKYAYKT